MIDHYTILKDLYVLYETRFKSINLNKSSDRKQALQYIIDETIIKDHSTFIWMMNSDRGNSKRNHESVYL